MSGKDSHQAAYHFGYQSGKCLCFHRNCRQVAPARLLFRQQRGNRGKLEPRRDGPALPIISLFHSPERESLYEDRKNAQEVPRGNGKHFRLKNYDPADTHGLDSEFKKEVKDLLANGVQELSRLQVPRRAGLGLLIIFQAMDAAGKI